MKFATIIEVNVVGATEDDVESEMSDVLSGVDMENAMASEIAQRVMVPDDDVSVTVHDVRMVKTKEKTR